MVAAGADYGWSTDGADENIAGRVHTERGAGTGRRTSRCVVLPACASEARSDPARSTSISLALMRCTPPPPSCCRLKCTCSRGGGQARGAGGGREGPVSPRGTTHNMGIGA